ncbi:MAG TPA: protealysin inhibitor emfourin [Streptosporangiales bacterium]
MRVEVRRSGGFAGIARTGSADLTDDEARALAETVRAAAAAATGRPVPDAFHYTVGVHDEEWTVGEHELAADVRARLQSILDAPAPGGGLPEDGQ